MKFQILAVALATAVVVPMAATAQQAFRNADEAIKYRQSAMYMQNYHLGRLFAMTTGRIPYDAKAALEHATLVDTIDHLPYGAFIEGTDKGERTTTRARPEIWTQRVKFDGLVTKLQEESAKMVSAARAGTVDTLRPAVGAVGAACKACHDDFQKN